MRDQQVGQGEARLQVDEQVDDLRLDRHVERGDRFVGDDQRRVEGEGAGQADALALAAAELVRIAPPQLGIEPDVREQLGDPRGALGLRADAMDDERLLDDRLDPHPRVERRVGVLEDHLHVRAAPRAARARSSARTSWPLNATWPDVGSIRRRMQRPVVVLPLPDSPTSPNVSPCSTANDTRSMARTSVARPNRPCRWR